MEEQFQQLKLVKSFYGRAGKLGKLVKVVQKSKIRYLKLTKIFNKEEHDPILGRACMIQ